MCSRYSLTSPPEAVRAYFGYADTPNFPARYNIAPTQPIPVVCVDREGARRFRLMRWGLLPSFVKDPKKFPTLINARSEEVLDKPSFRNAMRWRRCLIPADGFYEWTGPKGKRRPFLLKPKAPKLLAFAGLYERWRDGEGGEVDTVTILTCPANATVSRAARPHAGGAFTGGFRVVARRRGHRTRRGAEAVAPRRRRPARQGRARP